MELEELISSIDIVDFISQYVELEQKNDEFWGISPFKEEKTPSFSVRREINQWYDFSSGQGGNIFHFIKKYFQCSTNDAVEIIKKYAGYDGELHIGSYKLSATIACKKYLHKQAPIKEGNGVILDDDCMEKYVRDIEKMAVWENEGISIDVMDVFSVKYDPFSNRLVYPIKDLSGRTVNIGGRTLSDGWKERGLRKYTYFYPWGVINLIYGLYENLDYIKEKHEIILFEGVKSVYLAATWGIHNAGAILTSHLSKNQLKILAKLGCNVVFALDKDVDIRKDEHIKQLAQYVNVFYLYDHGNLLNEKDAPVDKGVEVFKKLYDEKRKLRA